LPVEHARNFAKRLLSEHGLTARPVSGRVVVELPGKTFGDFRTTHGKVLEALKKFKVSEGITPRIETKGVIHVIFEKAANQPRKK